MDEELLQSLIAEFVIDEKKEEWLRTPLPVFDGRSPQQMIDSGHAEPVICELWRLKEGMPL